MCIIARGVRNLSVNFGVSMTVLSRFVSQHLSDASRDLATFTFDLVGHGTCRWYGSSYSTSVLSFKFVSLSLRTIWRSSGLNVSRPDDLDTETGMHYLSKVDNLSTNFGVSRTFRFWLMGQQLSEASHDLTSYDLDLWPWRSLDCSRCGSSYYICVPSLKFVDLPFRKIWRTSGLSISRPGDLDLWP